MPTPRDLLQIARDIRARRTTRAPLEDLAAIGGWSPFHVHRTFRALFRETPKQYALRLRLQQAAVKLASSGASVLDVALNAGFESHEVFTRAFRRHFGVTPARYRAAALAGASMETRARHVAIVQTAGPCFSFYHVPTSPPRRSLMPTLSIERREMPSQHIVFVRKRAGRHELSSAIAEALGKAFPYTQRVGLAIAGRPFTRYLSTGPGLFRLEIGIPVATAPHGEGDVEPGTLPAGAAAVATHGGPYDQLTETYAALERWIESNGYRVSGAPWESYITDPADHPDPAEWRTEVYWPIENEAKN